MCFEQEAHVNQCYKHFYYFVTELNLVERKELEPLVSVGLVLCVMSSCTYSGYDWSAIKSLMHCNPIKNLHCIACILYWLLMHTAYFTGLPAVFWFLPNLVGWHTQRVRDEEWLFLAIHLSREPLLDRLVLCFPHDRNALSFKKVRDCLVLHVGQSLQLPVSAF